MSKLKHWYLIHSNCRRAINYLIWIVFIQLVWFMDLLSKYDDRRRFGVGTDDFRLVAEQITSANAVLFMLIPLSMLCHHIYKRHLAAKNALLMFVLGSIIFAFGHHVLMIMQRLFIYPLFDVDYVVTNFWWNVWFEYKKDIKIYLIGIILLLAYEFWLDRALTELNKLHSRLKVNTARGDTWVSLADVHYIKSERNYVLIQCHEKEYLLRETLQSLNEKLPSEDFIRIHRSYILNLRMLKELKYNNKGALTAYLSNGQHIPVGRSYQNNLKNAGQLNQ